MKKILTLILFFINLTGFSQAPIFNFTETYLSNTKKYLILADFEGAGPERKALRTLLYAFPINCDSVIILSPSYSVKWSPGDKYFACSTSSKLIIYNLKGDTINTIDNAYSYTFMQFDNYLFYYKNRYNNDNHFTQIYRFDITNGIEDFIYEFDSEFSIVAPDCEDECVSELDYYGGGYRSVIFKGVYPDFESYTFIISPTGKLKFFLKGRYLGEKEIMPEEGFIIKN